MSLFSTESEAAERAGLDRLQTSLGMNQVVVEEDGGLVLIV